MNVQLIEGQNEVPDTRDKETGRVSNLGSSGERHGPVASRDKEVGLET